MQAQNIMALFLMLSATLTGTIITKYENAFTAIPILVSFIPMLMDTGGNCGSQSSTLVIRGLALEEIKFKDIFKVMFKEFRIALVVWCCPCNSKWYKNLYYVQKSVHFFYCTFIIYNRFYTYAYCYFI